MALREAFGSHYGWLENPTDASIGHWCTGRNGQVSLILGIFLGGLTAMALGVFGGGFK